MYAYKEQVVQLRTPYLHNDGSEGLYLSYAAGCEARALVGIEHDQVDLALNILHQLHKPRKQTNTKSRKNKKSMPLGIMMGTSVPKSSLDTIRIFNIVAI